VAIRSAETAGHVQVNNDRNVVSLVIPKEGFTNVVRLVAAGFVSRLGFAFDAIDDLLLALELILRSVPFEGETASITLESNSNGLTLAVGRFDSSTLEREMHQVVRDGLEFARLLERLADDVELRNGSVVLHRGYEAAPI